GARDHRRRAGRPAPARRAAGRRLPAGYPGLRPHQPAVRAPAPGPGGRVRGHVGKPDAADDQRPASRPGGDPVSGILTVVMIIPTLAPGASVVFGLGLRPPTLAELTKSVNSHLGIDRTAPGWSNAGTPAGGVQRRCASRASRSTCGPGGA